MKHVSSIAYGISALEKAHLDGNLVNQSMVAFIFCKALMHELPNAHVVYDGRTQRDSETRPNLYIWQDGATPAVHFIGYIRYEQHEINGDQELIQSLKDYAAMPTVSLLSRDPVSLIYIEQPVKTAPNLELGLFIVGNREVKLRYWSAHREQQGQ